MCCHSAKRSCKSRALPENGPKMRKQAASESTTKCDEIEARLEDCCKAYRDCYQTNQSGSAVSHVTHKETVPCYLLAKDSTKRTERTGAVVDPIGIEDCCSCLLILLRIEGFVREFLDPTRD
ncbi:UNVERIFIED_CONTAM: hypothetical protein FKN15_023139 [Acipenser sinensis]